MMLPEEDRQALKKDGYKMTPKGVMPIAHPLQTYNRKSYSSESQLYRQGERESSSTSSTRTIQPKPNPSTNKPQGWQGYRQGERESSSTPTHSTQPKLNPSTNKPQGWQTYRQGERESSSTSRPIQPKPKTVSTNRREWENPSPQPKPKPIPGSATDLPEARKALQQTRDASQNLKKLNKGGVWGAELRDLQRETSIAEARVNASEAAKKLQDFPDQARRLKFNNRGITEELRSDLVQRANTAKERYMGTLGLDSSGQRIKLTPPSPPPAPEQPKQRSGLFGFVQDHVPGGDKIVNVVDKVEDARQWTVDKAKSGVNYVKDHGEEIGHGALDVAGFAPGLGAFADGINGVWYAAEGDWKNASFSFAAAIPGAGDALAAGKLGFKATEGVQKLAKVGTTAANVVNVGAVAEGGIVGGQYAMQGDWKNAALFFASSAAPAAGSVARKQLGKPLGNWLAERPLKNLDSISSSPTRPRWRSSETDVTKALGPKFAEQQSFFNREPVLQKTRGSSRPDNYRKPGLVRPPTSIEVKNYDLNRSGGQSSLVNKVIKQAQARTINLPAGTVQKVVIDTRGQKVNRQILNDLAKEIAKKSDGVLGTSDIKFIR